MTSKDIDSSKEVFSQIVERTANESNVTVLEACIAVASEFGIDVEDIPKYITTRVKEQIENESRSSGLIYRGSRKPENLDRFFS